MKKYLSLLLATSMLCASTITSAIGSPMPLLKKSNLAFEEVNQSLEETDKGFVFGKLEEDENTFKWNIREGGTYRLKYYVEHLNKTKKIELVFKVGLTDPNLIEFQADMTYGDAAEQIPFVEKVFPYNKWGEPQLGLFEKTLKLEDGNTPVAISEQEVSLRIDNFLNLKVMLDNKNIIVSTDSIEKGLITNVELVYENENPETIKLFKGPKDFLVTPTHLYEEDGHLKSKDFINGNEEEAGLKPGIQVAFDRPKYIKDEVFTPITEEEAKEIKGVLDLWPEFEIGQVEDEERIRLDFNLAHESAITGEIIKDQSKKLSVEDNRVNIYLSQDDLFAPSHQENIVKWETLNESMIIGGLLELSGGVLSDLSHNIFEMNPKGYTYLKFRAFRKNEKEITIELLPYKIESEITYKVYNRYESTSAWNEVMSYKYKGEDYKEPIQISFLGATTQQYKIEAYVEGDTQPFISQTLEYNPIHDAIIPPVSQIEDVFNVYVTPDEKNSKKAESIGFDMSFQAPSYLKSLLEKGDVYYELYLHNSEQKLLHPIKVFKVSENQNEVQIEAYKGTINEQANLIYDETKNLFVIEGIHLKNFGEKGLEYLLLNDEMLKNQKDYPTTIDKKQDLDFKIPDHYYLSLKTVFDPKDENKHLAISGLSNLKSLTLSLSKEVLPTIDHYTDTKISDDTHEISFTSGSIKSYVDKMLTPLYWSLWQEEEKAETFYQGHIELLLSESETFKTPIRTIQVTEGERFILDEQSLFDLRKGETLLLNLPVKDLSKTLDHTIRLIGLDDNKVYYIKSQIALNAWRSLSDVFEEKRITSAFSALHSITTQAEPIPPTADDKVPPTPNKFFIVEEPKNGEVTLGWETPNMEQVDKMDTLYYEMVRTTDIPLEDIDMDRKKTIETLVQEKKNLKGFRTKNTYIEKFDQSTQYQWEKERGDQLSSRNELKDFDLNPNTIYYYYIRTVGEFKGKTIASQWIYLPVTTHPIDKPIDLKIEPTKNYKYNPEDEVVISFYAPISSASLVPEKYDFEIVLKKDEGDYELVKGKKLKSQSTEEKEGYTHFVYKLTDLKPSSRYDVKVRMVDKTKPKPYPTSLYSNKVSFRTDYNEVSSENESLFEDYLLYFDQQANKIKNKPYWIGQEKDTVYMKYKADYLKGHLQQPYVLENPLNSKNLVYYMPADVFIGSNPLAFNLAIGDFTIDIRKNTFTAQLEAIEKTLSKIDKKKIQDFYIALTFSTSPSSEMGALSPEIEILAEIVEVNETEKTIESQLREKLDHIIEKERKQFIKVLEKELNQNKVIHEDTFKAHLEDALEVIEAESQRMFEMQFEDFIEEREWIEKGKLPLFITYPIQSYQVQGYLYNKGWQLAGQTYPLLDRFALESHLFGRYLFKGQSGQNQTGLSPQTQSLIAKYQLTDFIKIDETSLKQPVSKQTFYQVVARLMGAAKNAQPDIYLNSKQIKGVNRIGLYQPITLEDSVYLLMQVYEKNHHKPIQNFVIGNKQKVMNLQDFAKEKQPYLLAAVELGVVQPTLNKVHPKATVTGKTLLDMVTKMMIQ